MQDKGFQSACLFQWFDLIADDVFLGRHPVIGENTAVCVYYSEDICLLLAILVFQRTTLYDKLRIIRKSKVFNFSVVLKLYDLSEVSLL